MEPDKKASADVANLGCLSLIINLAIYGGIIHILYLALHPFIKYIEP